MRHFSVVLVLLTLRSYFTWAFYTIDTSVLSKSEQRGPLSPEDGELHCSLTQSARGKSRYQTKPIFFCIFHTWITALARQNLRKYQVGLLTLVYFSLYKCKAKKVWYSLCLSSRWLWSSMSPLMQVRKYPTALALLGMSRMMWTWRAYSSCI